MTPKDLGGGGGLGMLPRLWPVSWSLSILRILTFPICSKSVDMFSLVGYFCPFVHVSNDLSHISCVSLHNTYIIVYVSSYCVFHRHLHIK